MNADNTPVDAHIGPRYQLKSIDVTLAPEGGEGTWYRYVIAQGSNEITGMRPGTLAEVDIAVREIVVRLNERSAGKSTKKPKVVPGKTSPTSPDKSSLPT